VCQAAITICSSLSTPNPANSNFKKSAEKLPLLQYAKKLVPVAKETQVIN
jgi:hypothetical protein